MSADIWDFDDPVRAMARTLNEVRRDLVDAMEGALLRLNAEEIWEGNDSARRAHAIAAADKAFAALLSHPCIPLPETLDVVMDLPEGVR